MAVNGGVPPAYCLPCRRRVLHLESLSRFSTSKPLLIRVPIGRRNFHFTSDFSQLIVAKSSWGFRGKEGAGDAREVKRNAAYGVSRDWEEFDSDYVETSGRFMQNRSGASISRASSVDRNRIGADANYGTEFGNSKYEGRSRYSNGNIISSLGEDFEREWRQPLSSKVPDSPRKLRLPSKSSGLERRSREIRPRQEKHVRDDYDVIGGWMGTREPSENFKNSSIYKQPSVPLDNAVKHQRGVGSNRYPSPPPSSGKVPKYLRPIHEKTKSLNRKRPKSKLSSPTESTPETPTPHFQLQTRNTTDYATSSDFIIPPVIKPELPYQFSYSETPKETPLGYREPLYSPFGHEGVTRPYLGRPSKMKKTKKIRAESWGSFDSPRADKNDVKPIHRSGSHPEPQPLGKSRAKILGAPLTTAEVEELVMQCQKEDRQLNLGRDGFTHNMLASVHDYWKRRQVVRIKCKGVPTVDMDNVCTVLEDKTGGKIISRAGGVVYLFRGRNYNYNTRPKIPLMLWRPPAPVYPKLIQRAPEGLTVEEADSLRRRGRKIPAICHLGKNGVYLNLVRDVRNAFQADNLVKVDCEKMNTHDLRKIGAKLKDLVPCVLLSFDHECILMWKGPESVESSNELEDDYSRKSGPSASKDSSENGNNEDDEWRSKSGPDIDSDADESIIAGDEDWEAAHKNDEAQEPIQEEGDFSLTKHRALISETDVPLHDTDAESHAGSDVKSSYCEEEAELPGKDITKPEFNEAIREFESLWQAANSSGEVLLLDEREVDPDHILELVKDHFGGVPMKPRTKGIASKNTARSAAMKTTKLERVPRDSSGLVQVDELARLLAP
ncbi:uncharacterized protein [Physcomitrium patens]|uniref:CRM domain-containing protein n=1 Tax=Physcomitrium patens TaxID=3218 RepID=A0A7I4EDY2_PHYPA|nr:CRS2-associated factor 1, chloroplastic-like isoform X2 [Physcomitrium patens]|eukprot:XP_024382628.1 CRS2-associated factor 1, chloroplastic-like isoform X2 [Physcomitrella patens]